MPRRQIRADDPVRPVRHVVLVVLSVLLTIVASSSAAAVQARVPAQTKKQAEINVLRALPRTWPKRKTPDLVDARTRLVVNNTQAICRGRGKRYSGRRYARFVCVIRPAVHRPHKGLYVSYRALRQGRFRMHWLAYKH
jgi:hypothetical protein